MTIPTGEERPPVSARTTPLAFFRAFIHWPTSLSHKNESAPQRYQYPPCLHKTGKHPLSRLQIEAGRIIGGGPRAFQKYESGDLLPGRAISSALRLLDRDPQALGVLKFPQNKENVA
jgi:hypothetical protein